MSLFIVKTVQKYGEAVRDALISLSSLVEPPFLIKKRIMGCLSSISLLLILG